MEEMKAQHRVRLSRRDDEGKAVSRERFASTNIGDNMDTAKPFPSQRYHVFEY